MTFNPAAVLAAIPEHFISDCCSGGAPNRIFGHDLKPFCRAHDAAYCTRLWPPGTLDQAWRHAADRQLGVEVRAELPYVLDWIGWLFFRAVHRFGGDDAYDSCGPEFGERCRHNLELPEWMR